MNAELRKRVEAHGRWFLACVRSAGDGCDVEGFHEHLSASPQLSPDRCREIAQWWWRNLGPDFEVEPIEDGAAGELRYRLLDAKSRPWVAAFSHGPERPWRLTAVRLDRQLPEGIEVRDAVPGDGPAIAELYRTTPIQAGDVTVTIDPGDDYFVTTRLMEESHTLVATEHGRVIGVYCGTLYAGSLNGLDATLMLGCHSRLAPGKAGGGVWSNMNRTLLDRFNGRADVPLAFVLVGNAAASRLTAAGAWPAHPVRALLRCDAAAEPAGRPATADDADELVEILNASNEGQDLFRRYTPASLTERLERAPDLYTWEDVWIASGAAVGVGRAHQGRVVDDDAGHRETRRALVFDHGHLEGAEAALMDLLAGRGAEAARRGASHLSVFTTEGAAAFPLLVGAAEAVESYDVLIPGHTPDDGAAIRGIHVDQVHF